MTEVIIAILINLLASPCLKRLLQFYNTSQKYHISLKTVLYGVLARRSPWVPRLFPSRSYAVVRFASCALHNPAIKSACHRKRVHQVIGGLAPRLCEVSHHPHFALVSATYCTSSAWLKWPLITYRVRSLRRSSRFIVAQVFYYCHYCTRMILFSMNMGSHKYSHTHVSNIS